MITNVLDNEEIKRKVYANAKKHGWHNVDMPDSHWLFMIVTEMAEAVQADRHDRHAYTDAYCAELDRIFQVENYTGRLANEYVNAAFETYIKDSVEDELADILIRCYDFAGLRDINLDMLFGNSSLFVKEQIYFDKKLADVNLSTFFGYINSYFTRQQFSLSNSIARGMYLIWLYAEIHNIDLTFFVELKMRYNETRPYMHNNCKY